MKTKVVFSLHGVLFAAIFCVLLYLMSCILSFKYKDGIQPMRDYYDLPQDTVDVLLLGSSHMGVNVNPTQLWDDCGIAAYNCWGAMQPDWNTYYYLKECLKTQEPKLVVMDVYMTASGEEYADYSGAVKNTMGMKLSREKIEAVKASAQKNLWSALLMGFPAYHSRYAEINKDDFGSFFWNKHTDLQTAMNDTAVFPTSILDTSKIDETMPLTKKSEKYLRLILSFCRGKNIPILLINAPCTLSKVEQCRFNRVRQIAAEYDVDFYNYNDNYKEIGIHPQKDFSDASHLNSAGIHLYTAALEKLLKSKYDLPDRRKDSNHIWNKRAEDGLKPVYILKQQFVGDGKQNYVDTGLKLASNPLSSWTLLSELKVPSNGDFSKVLFSCFDEAKNNNHGILLHEKEDGTLSVVCSPQKSVEIRNMSGIIKIALVKSNTALTVYCNGQQIQTIQIDDVKSFDGNLLIGCEQQPNGEKYRFSPVTVHALEVYDTAVSESFVSAWSPTWPPMPKANAFVPANSAEMKLSNRFAGDGIQNYLDTGRKLYENPDSSWTLLSQISPVVQDGDSVYFSCFNEKEGDYKGILVRRGYPGKLNIMYGSGIGVTVDIPTDRETTLAVRKDRSEYTIYVNGKKIVDRQISACTAYGGSLLVGCERDESGKLFRYSGTTVYNLWLVKGLMSETDILNWLPKHAPEAVKPKGSSVNYVLEHSFAGNGEGTNIDTGVRLYDTTDKKWTLQVQLDMDSAIRGAVLSCFAEDPNNYRGLLIRQTDDRIFGITTGQSFNEVTVPPGQKAALTVVKSEYRYTIYVNGEQAASVESRCAAYNGPLLLGCERRLNGKSFRFSNVKVRALSVYDGAYSAEQVKELTEGVKAK